MSKTVETAETGPGATVARLLSLDMRRDTLRHALTTFAVFVPVLAVAASFARNPGAMSLSLALYTAGCGGFYALMKGLQRERVTVPHRAWRHLAATAVWAGAAMQVVVFAHDAGPIREALVLIAMSSGVCALFFATPSRTSAILASAALLLGPLSLMAAPGGGSSAALTGGISLLAIAMAAITNHMLRAQFLRAAERERLLEERAAALNDAKALAQAKSDVVAALSHEIRNGLTGVTHVLAGAAGGEGRTPPTREQFSAALEAARDLIGVLNVTLDSETAGNGLLAVEMGRFDPTRLVHDLVLLERAHASAKGLELNLHIAPELEIRGSGAVTADALRTRQILANLISNAIKYTSRGRIEVRLERPRPDCVTFAIADTGPGLSPDELVYAFEAFRRVERTGAGVPGAGLGLSLSRQLAQLMGGRLSAQSALGVGSCFTVELPYDPHAVLEGEQPDADEHVPAPVRGLRVLVAEDDGLNAAMMRAILEQLGHQVVHAQNGRRALELAELCDFDLMMLDGRMPYLDGPQTAAAVRRLPGHRGQTPIIAVTGGDDEETQACMDAGADAAVRKPVTVAGIARAVSDVTQPRKPVAEDQRAAG
ncbi:ATP-binding protein [Caulobacter segnis]|uniref:ATP-binding protein n=1 Tax=Caulobacter segnis TaxID=88688 RepID=UPI00240F2B8D|nr:ATP-binding protein [Caulobacter segnis]MDG2523544.1 ATP-binding protein [Caulobacter segnis]